MKIVVPIDGSAHSIQALNFLTEHLGWYRTVPTVDLVCVQAPLPTRLPHMALTMEELERYYSEEGETALAAACNLLERAHISYEKHILVGTPAESIVAHAAKSGADLIVIATRGMGGFGSPLLGSTAVRIQFLSRYVPVMVVNTRVD